MAITVQVQLWYVTAGSAVTLVPAATKRHAELVLLGNLIAQGTDPNRQAIRARLATAADVERMRSWAADGDIEAQKIMALCADAIDTEIPAEVAPVQIELFAS